MSSLQIAYAYEDGQLYLRFPPLEESSLTLVFAHRRRPALHAWTARREVWVEGERAGHGNHVLRPRGEAHELLGLVEEELGRFTDPLRARLCADDVVKAASEAEAFLKALTIEYGPFRGLEEAEASLAAFLEEKSSEVLVS